MQSHEPPLFVSPMYDRLETNIPHTLMAYSDDPSLADDQLFPSRESVLRYLQYYADDVRHLVKFQTVVTQICQDQSIKDGWQVESRDLLSDRVTSRKYDAVVVASGHYAVPYVPEVKGIRQWNEAYPGRISHSKFYRHPKYFAGKKTIIIGNSASGLDLSSQIRPFCDPPIIMSQRSISPILDGSTSGDTIVRSEVVEFLSPPSNALERAVRFTDGHIEEDVDAILFCTGYHYSFPFLTSLQPALITTGERVHHLFQHIFYTASPTLAFVGIPSKILPFRTCEGQAAVIARMWSGRLDMPSEIEMDDWEEARVAERGIGRKFHQMRTLEDLDYHNAMIDWAESAKPSAYGKLPKRWSDEEYWARGRFPAIKEAFANEGERRNEVRTMDQLGFNYSRKKVQLQDQNSDTAVLAFNGLSQ